MRFIPLLFIAPITLLASVECVWSGGSYVCSGSGDSVVVGPGDASALPPVVTNVWGVCTNCVAMTPEYCSQFKADVMSSVSILIDHFQDVTNIASYVYAYVESTKGDISTFRRFSDLPTTATDYNVYAFTSYVYSVDNTQTELCRQARPTVSSGTVYMRYWISYGNGIYDYAQSLVPTLDTELFYIDEVVGLASMGVDESNDIRTYLDEYLVCDQCQPEYGSGSDPGGDGGGGGSSDGRWCTEEQGEAIKDYLRRLNETAVSQKSYLTSISNNVFGLRESVSQVCRALWNNGTIIVDDGANSWSNVYNSGQSQLYNYDSSNILQRIELLLYGLSLPSGSNAEDTTPSDDEFDDAVDQIRTMDDIKRSTGDVVARYENISDAISGFVDRLNFFGPGSFSPFNVIEPMLIFDSWDFEFSVSSAQIGYIAGFRRLFRTVLQVVYWIVCAFGIFGFWYSLVHRLWGYVLWLFEFVEGVFSK